MSPDTQNPDPRQDPPQSRGAAAPTSAEHAAHVRRAAFASAIGTSIEWYDYFLYGLAAALVFPKLFFPNQSHYNGLLTSFGTYAIGFAARPVGAAIFGHWGDRIGRKAMLIITLLMMGLSTAAIGVLPGANDTGGSAWVLLVALIVLRSLQGIAVGGEWSGSVLLSMEWGDQKRRGLFGSWPQLGVAIGLLLATSIMTLLNNVVSSDAFLSWGWRVPFLFSLVLVAIGLYIRLRILETPIFRRVVTERRTVRAPIPEVIRHHWREIILSALVRMSEQMPFYVVTVFVVSYVVDRGHSRNFALIGTLVAAALEFVLVPYFGNMSDRVGRKRIYMAGAALMGVWGFLYIGLLNSAAAWVVFLGICIGLIPHSIQYGPQASLIAENFPTKLRYGGSGLGYQLASVIAGGPAPVFATYLLHHTGTAYSVAIYMLASSVITLVACALLPDRAGVDLEDDAAYEGGAAVARAEAQPAT